MQFSTTTIVLAMAYFAGIVAAAPLASPIEAAPADVKHLVARRKYRHCACQSATDGSILNDATNAVVAASQGKWHTEAGAQIVGQSNAHYSGIYAVASAPNSSIDGKEFYDACKKFGGADSTCF